jgi:hypothetical protein
MSWAPPNRGGIPIFIQKAALDFGVDLVQPLLCAISLLLIGGDLGFKIGHALFRCAKLLRKLLRGIDSMPAILISDIRSFVKELQNRVAGRINLAAVVVLPLR